MTSILSRRWLKLWLHTPILNFHAPISDRLSLYDSERQNYVNWVNSVLQLHMAHYLKEFRVFCYLTKDNSKDIDSWLEYALARKVQNLELNLSVACRYSPNSADKYVFPETLLNLSHDKAIRAVIPNSGGSRSPEHDFKCLESLSLKSVDVTSEAINFFLLNCPYLQRLEVAGNGKLVSLVISDPTLVLKYLQITDCFNLEAISISNFKLVSLYISTVKHVTLTDLPMLVDLSITGYRGMLRHCFSQTSSCHSQLEALTLTTCDQQEIVQLPNLSQMTKLKHLLIEVEAWHDRSLTELISFISSCPHLMEFVLMLRWFHLKQTSRALHKDKKCSLKHLKVFELIGYAGRVIDVELIMHVVDNAAALEKVIIDPRVELPGQATSHNEDLLREREARIVALFQFEGLRESIPSHIDLFIR